MNNSPTELVTTILAVGSVVAPIVFGFVLWKMSQIFVTAREFQEYKATQEQRRQEMVRGIEEIRQNTILLLQRTAKRGKYEGQD